MAKHVFISRKDIRGSDGTVRVAKGDEAVTIESNLTADEALAGIHNGHFVPKPQPKASATIPNPPPSSAGEPVENTPKKK